MDSIPKEITTCTLQLTGVFARLKCNRMTVDEAMEFSLSVTDKIEKKVSQLAQDNKTLRPQNKTLHTEKYKLKERLMLQEQKVSKQEQKLCKLQQEYQQLLERE